MKRSIAYIMNPVKTEDGLLIGDNAGTTPEEVFEVMMETKRDWDKTEGRQGYHFIISWKPGEVTKMQAWQMADELRKKNKPCGTLSGDEESICSKVEDGPPGCHGCGQDL